MPGGRFLAVLGSSDSPDRIGDWLGRPMFFSGHDADTNRPLLVEAGFDLLVDEIDKAKFGDKNWQWLDAQERTVFGELLDFVCKTPAATPAG